MIESRERVRERHLRIKLEALKHYGGDPPVCQCCGEAQLEFLTFDHSDGVRAAQIAKAPRSGHRMHYWMKRSGWPAEFKVLCFNCNCAKRDGLACPHQLKNLPDSELAFLLFKRHWKTQSPDYHLDDNAIREKLIGFVSMAMTLLHDSPGCFEEFAMKCSNLIGKFLSDETKRKLYLTKEIRRGRMLVP